MKHNGSTHIGLMESQMVYIVQGGKKKQLLTIYFTNENKIIH